MRPKQNNNRFAGNEFTVSLITGRLASLQSRPASLRLHLERLRTAPGKRTHADYGGLRRGTHGEGNPNIVRTRRHLLQLSMPDWKPSAPTLRIVGRRLGSFKRDRLKRHFFVIDSYCFPEIDTIQGTVLILPDHCSNHARTPTETFGSRVWL